jgi:hypothetical protein
VGYVFVLPDGYRKGEVGDIIGVNGDWFVLGNLIFNTHLWAPTEHADRYKEHALLSSKWQTISHDPSPEELQTFLERIQGWTVAPRFDE